MKKSVPIFILISVLLALTGCQDAEPEQTVEWYKAHDAERTAVIQKCKNNPGELDTTLNCINARKAAMENAANEGVLNLPKGNIWKK